MQAQVEVELLREQAAAGDLVRAHVDEAGLAQVHPNRSVWSPQGERHLIEATRGKRLNLLAAMLSKPLLGSLVRSFLRLPLQINDLPVMFTHRTYW